MKHIIFPFTRNPLLIREIVYPTKSANTLLIGLLVGVIIILFCTAALFLSNWHDGIRLTLAFVCFIAVSLSPFVAFTSAIVTTNELHDRNFELLHLTTMTNLRLVEGYILSSLYHCRGLFLAIIGFSPLTLIVAMVVLTSDDLMFCTWRKSCELEAILNNSSLVQSNFIALGLHVLGISALSVGLGVLSAVLWRNKFLSIITAVILALFTTWTLIFILLRFGTLEFFQLNLVYVPVSFLLFVITVTLAHHFIRETS